MITATTEKRDELKTRDVVLSLISRAKDLADAKEAVYIDPDSVKSLANLLTESNREIIDAVRADRDSALSLLRLLSRSGETEAVHSLLANLEISRSDASMLEAAINLGLGGDAEGTHKWIVDYDVVGQRLEVIQSIILPYVDANCPEKTLFRALKEYEAETLALNNALLNAAAIYEVIGATRQGVPFPRSNAGSTPPDRSQSIRLALPNETFSALLRLAWTAQDYVFDLHDRHSPDDLIAIIRTLNNVVPVYLIPTHLGYPMGGGESFMHQTCRILSEFGIKCVWVSFLDPKSGWYTRESITYTPYYIDVRYAGGCSKDAILRAVEQFNPDLIHSQGATNDPVMEVAEETRLTTLAGYHFWSGLVELGRTGNQHIIDNLSEHEVRHPPVKQSPLIRKYVASEFMLDVYSRLGGKEKLQVIHPISDTAQFLANREDSGKYVLQVNVCALKGGEIFLNCVNALGDDIPFMGIQSEPDNSDLPARLAEEVAQHPQCVLKSYGNVRDFYRTARMVIVPTLVDETFCRVAFEAAMNGIPVLSTTNGYLSYMLGDAGVFLQEDSAEWVEKVRELYFDTERLKQIGERQRARLQEMFGSDFGTFIKSAMSLIDNSTTRNIGIFTVWGDQGLGNLAHSHARLLRSVGYRVHVFSFQPYSAINKSLMRQNDPNEWGAPEHADSVYYSYNHREEVTVHELTQFILVNSIHTLLVPEVCWQPNWERLFALQVRRLAVCNIPMIEIVIRDEIQNHNRLTKTLYCTHQAERTMTDAGVRNGAFLGHGFGRPLPHHRVDQKRRRLSERPKIRFLHVAGHNPRIRKNTPQVIDAFAKALALRADIELTVTSMDPVLTYYTGEIPAGITIIDRSLSRDEILELYENHDVSIQVSSHEGLGLGFYESISRCTPVLSLDAPPHNEIVLEGETGWLIPAQPIPLPDNDRSLVSAWRFDSNTLANRIVSLGRGEIEQCIVSTERIFRTRFDEVALLTRFLQTLPRGSKGGDVSDDAAPVMATLVTTDAPAPQSAPIKISTEPKLVETVPSVLPAGGMKLRLKKILHRIGRQVYRLAKPVTRRIAYRLRAITMDATSDLRSEVQRLSDVNRKLHDSILNLSEAQSKHQQDHWLIAESLSRRLEGLSSDLTKHQEAIRQGYELSRNTLSRISHDAHFLKVRSATYAGPGAVLTYLRDESPIFANTGDLGCPSPIINGGVWEPENLDVLYSFVTSDTVFLDIGANIGYFSIAIGNRLGPNGRVLAFEPHPSLVNLLERSIQLNSLENVIQIQQCALSDHEGTLDLFYPEGHLGQGSSTRTFDEHGYSLSAPAHRLDDLLPEGLAVDLVKIDVEGHELSVLRGMRGVLARSPNIKILFEKLEASSQESSEIASLLGEFGLSLYGVGPYSSLVPLDQNSYRDWIGDVLAAPSHSVDQLSRTSFSVYPGQLSGEGRSIGTQTRYRVDGAGPIFVGPDWFLRRGTWQVRLRGKVHGLLRLAIKENHEAALAELYLSGDKLTGHFRVDHDVAHFTIEAYGDAGTAVELERVEFEPA